ncbi:probable 2-oxoglutarate-dependent dioxygenase AOP1 [Herrania umbratica]|uniref:2-oxoglutarate-dependent dioxygenase DAO n=1 Tax=Herrania umbratica TaxID=108875 RepID=A0A6J0ZPZ2_9ROSI|nr:probable 2-oxoglutarate-dependent dioxygenase AOP1 [Herrania umbratica]
MKMGSVAEFQIPVIELPAADSPDLERGTEGWQRLCRRVREACENYGCFQVVYERIPRKLREETFSLVRELVEVPLERKQKNVNPKPYHSYFGPCSQVSLYEGFGIEDASNYDSVKSFAQVMWPDGHHHFCQTVNSMAKQLEELNHIIWLMIIDSYELGEKWESLIMRCYMLLRMMKYMAPPSGDYVKGLYAHTDKPASAIVCEDQISGLEIEIKDGEWTKVFPSPRSFVFLVGDPLMAWSNGRMKAAKHRVMMSGDRDRYSLGAFAVPVEGTIIKAPKELVSEEHPQVFKEFEFTDFLFYASSEEAKKIDSAEQIYAYASQLRNY